MRNDLFEYKHTKGGIYIKSYIGDKQEVEIPSIIDGKRVTIVGDGAFSRCSSLTSITIPDSVTSIGHEAFYGCSSLTSITIPSSVTSIGNYAFYGCSRLTNITIPNSVTSIGNYAFYECSSLTSITIPEGVTSIENGAFEDCSSPTNATFLQGLKSISLGHGAFSNCKALISIKVEEGNKKYHSKDNCLIETATNKLILGCNNSVIPNYVTSIGDYAFFGCNITSITIPNSVTNIGKEVFSTCWNLKSINIPESVTSIGSWAFYGCKSLTSIIIPNSVTNIGERLFSNCSKLKKITIPDSVTSIRERAFEWCINLKSITIPDSVTSIGDGAFEYCSSLTSITIPSSVTSIGERVFSFCQSLTSVNIPDSVTNIEEDAFLYCQNLESITIPNSVINIEEGAFKDCSKLRSIGHNKKIDNFKRVFEGCKIKEKKFLKDNLLLEEAPKKSLTKKIIEKKDVNKLLCECKDGVLIIPEGVTAIGEEAFYRRSSLENVILPNSLISIGKYAFSTCWNLKSINIPESVKSIGSWAFYGCKSLTSINIPSSLKNWLNIDFEDCSANPLYGETNSMTYAGNGNWEKICYYKDLYLNGELLNKITIPPGVTIIKPFAFAGYKHLLNINIPSSVTSIGEGAFVYCDNLTSITIPDSVTSIGEDAFSGCSSLTSITIPESVTSIGEDAFANCKKLIKIVVDQNNTRYRMIDNCLIDLDKNKLLVAIKNVKNVTIPENVTQLEPYAFSGCSSLTSITIPSSVTSIENGAFSGCSSLTSIDIPSSVTTIGNSAFKRCTSLNNIVIPINVVSVGDNAFAGCIMLSRMTIQNSKIKLGDKLLNDYNDYCQLKSLKVPYGFRVTKKSFGDIESSIISYEHFNELTTCLDENGEKIYDYGDKQIKIKLLSNMKFAIYDLTNNKKIKTLPKSTKNEDSKVIGGFVEDFKNIKVAVNRKIKEYNSDIIASLNKGEEYSKTTFNNMFDNAIAATLATGILWGLYDKSDNLKCAFRVLGKDNYVDINDSKVVINNEDILSVVDASQLSMDEVNKWKQILWSDNKSQLVRQFEAPIYYVPLNKLKERYIGATLEKQDKFETPYITLIVPYSYRKSLVITEVSIKAFNINTMSSHEKRLLNRSIIDADKASLAEQRVENLVVIGDLQGIKTAKETAIITADNIAHFTDIAIKQENAEVTAYLMELKKDMIGDVVDLDWEI